MISAKVKLLPAWKSTNQSRSLRPAESTARCFSTSVIIWKFKLWTFDPKSLTVSQMGKINFSYIKRFDFLWNWDLTDQRFWRTWRGAVGSDKGEVILNQVRHFSFVKIEKKSIARLLFLFIFYINHLITIGPQAR